MRMTTIMVTLAATLMATPAGAKTINVSAGQSIQAAVDAAAPGDRIVVASGIYHETGVPCPSRPTRTCAVAISKDGIALVAKGLVILDDAGDQDRGIEVAPVGAQGATCLDDAAQQIHGSTIRGFVVQGFEQDGIRLFCVDDWLISDVVAKDDLEYGIFPSHSRRGRVTRSIATGANDTGIYIGQSHDVNVDHNLVTDNVSGYEIENSTGVRLHHNIAIGNTGGILSFTLPFLDVNVNDGNQIDHNLVLDNNRDNTCLDPEDAVCGVLPGTGILLLAADGNVVKGNVVAGNRSFGIAVVNFCVAQGIPQEDCDMLDIQPDSDRNTIKNNAARDNGTDPAADIAPLDVDLAWDGTGVGNCWKNNDVGTQFPPQLPGC